MIIIIEKFYRKKENPFHFFFVFFSLNVKAAAAAEKN